MLSDISRRFRHLFPLISASVIGIVGGYYIFSPGLKQIAQEQQKKNNSNNGNKQ